MTNDLARLVQARHLAVGESGRRVREGAAVSLRELAAVIGTDIAGLSRWERGLTRPRGAAALRWLDAIETLQTHLETSPTDQDPRPAG